MTITTTPSEIQVVNPATGEAVGKVARSTHHRLRQSVERARAAQREWGRRSFSGRAVIVSRFHDLVAERREEILDAIQQETGKCRRDALGELLSVMGTARYYVAHGEGFLQEERHRGAVPGLTKARVIYRPHGVAGLISPWNYPFLLSIGDALPALLAGNAVVIKPSELTPFSAELAVELLRESGLEPDLATVLHGDGDLGAELIRWVDYVGFTGSVETGRKVAVAAGERLIPYSLELGGKNPMVVLEGAPLEDAVQGLLAAAFFNSGQTCLAVERVYIQDSIFEEFRRLAVDRTRRLKLGWSLDFEPDMGSLVSHEHADKVYGHIRDALEKGATPLCGGRRRPDLGPAFIEPTLLAEVTPDMAVHNQETFGPVVALHRIADAEEGIDRANDTPYGLNASVWSGSGRHSLAVARRLEAGSTGINSALMVYNSFDVPMGGIKDSGVGRRHGRHGIVRFTEMQSIVTSFATGGGYDRILEHVRSEKAANRAAAIFKLWRRIPGLR